MQLLRDGVALAHDDGGRGDPPLLLIHGWGTDRTLMRPLFDLARPSRRVVSVALRGFGDGDAPGHVHTIQAHADDVAFLASRLGLEPAVVVGHSMGGMIALDLAARHPAHTAAAIILEGMVVASDAVRAGLASMLDAIRAVGHRDYVTGLMSYLAGPHFDPAARVHLVASALACPQRALVSALEGIIAFDSVAAAAAVRCPLLYVGTSTTYADLPRFRALCPQLVTGQLVGCGHYFPVEIPEQLHPMIARFIATHVAK
jgi:pimeloyl-ACP methyl ester carboxylesterase